MKRLTSIFALVALFSIASFATEKETIKKANNLSISGKILDSNTNEPLAGVEVKLDGTNQSFYTDFEGNYKINNLTAGDYNINISYISYNEVKPLKISADKNIDLKISTK